MKRRSTIHLDT